MADIYCYPGTDVLINLLNIKNDDDLRIAETELTTRRCAQLQISPIHGRFDFTHLCAIHKHIFQDVYSWAGQIRNGDIAKGNTLFCLSQNIPTYAEEVFSSYYQDCFSARDDIQAFAHVLADHYADVNCLHPFREGNGRTQREFARELCLACGYVFNLSHVNQKDMISASASAYYGNIAKLEQIFEQALEPVRNK